MLLERHFCDSSGQKLATKKKEAYNDIINLMEMMDMRIALVDDTPEELVLLKSILDNELPTADVSSFPSGEAFLSSWESSSYDVILLDIYMDEMLGINVARKVRETDLDVRIVFCTTSNEFASESYEVGANYYLQKPVSTASFQRMMKMLRLTEYEQNRFITLPDGQQIVLRNITYTEYYNHSIIIHSKKRADLQTRMSQTEWESLLSEHKFLYGCSKGIVVNFYEVECVKDGMFLLKDKSLVPVSRRKLKDTMDAYAQFQFELMRTGGC